MSTISFRAFGFFTLFCALVSGILVALLVASLLLFRHGGDVANLAPVLGFLLIGCGIASVVVWLWVWFVGYLPFNALRGFLSNKGRHAKVVDVISGLLAATIALVPVIYLLLEDQAAAETSGVTSFAVLASLSALIVGPVSAVFLLKPGKILAP